jgi:hypothetical protein
MLAVENLKIRDAVAGVLRDAQARHEAAVRRVFDMLARGELPLTVVLGLMEEKYTVEGRRPYFPAIVSGRFY